ncbi:MAG: DUF4129 domain-containing protein [Theionarchaea archaeon]|nr:DUF4129 domain-containing protein [Theionarchaea archaeon]
MIEGGIALILYVVEPPPPEQIEEDLQEILDKLGYNDPLPDGPTFNGFPLEILLVILLIIVLAFIASQIVSHTAPFSMSRSMPAFQREEEKLVEKKDYRSLYIRAVDLGKRGQYLEAVRMAYMALLILLDVHDIIAYHPYFTNFEYRLKVRSYPFHSLFNEVTETFDTVFYGNQQATGDHFQQCIDVFSSIEGVLT